MRQQIITWLYEENVVRKYGCDHLRKYTSTIQEDLVAETWLLICEIPDTVLIDLWNQGKDHLTAYIKTFVERSLSPTGRTRKVRKLLTTETPVEFKDKNYEEGDTNDFE